MDRGDGSGLSIRFRNPNAIDRLVPLRVADAQAAIDTGLAQLTLAPREVEARCRDLVCEGTIAL